MKEKKTVMEKQTLIEMFRKMIRIREFENEAIELAKRNETRAAVHTYIGQEAIAVGVCEHMSEQDFITSTHRGHGHCIAKGANLERMFGELLGREEGYCKGKGGSMHIADLSTGNLGANGIVGGGIPLAVGAALSLELSKSQHYVVCFFGDGASNQGAFHEALNLASIWALPVIFVCENNEYAISTSVTKSVNIENISDRAIAYGIMGRSVDGNDVVSVYDAMGLAIEHVLSGKGPVLLEMKTYRIKGHYFGDNQNYRTRDEVNVWKEKDPIKRCELKLQDDFGVSSEIISKIKEEESKRVLDASSKAKLMNEPRIEDLTEDLYDPHFQDIKWLNPKE